MVMKLMTLTSLAFVLANGPDTRFASAVVSFAGLGPGIYGEPTAVLGKPATWIKDEFDGGPDDRVAVSWGYPAWNTDPEGRPVVATIQPGGHITVLFDPPIVDDPRHWHGLDFIVYGNPLLGCYPAVVWDTDLATVHVASGGDFIEPSAVSVSQDGLVWYTYPVGPHSGADGYWPTMAFAWDRSARSWGPESDWTKPVPPDWTRASLSGRSLAEVSERLAGAAGGCAFDLAPSGFRWIRYVRVSGAWGEVDAFARVGGPTLPVPNRSMIH
jgi:hypothetical protein